MIRFDEYELEPARRQLTRAGAEVHLTPKAFELLWALGEAAPRVVSKQDLHRRLWPNGVVSDATLVGLVKELRRALQDKGRTPPLIRTHHRVGYSLNRESGRPLESRLSRWLVIGERRVAVTTGELLIGRDPTADVRIEHATVSRRHARLLVGDDHTSIEDLASKNGTLIDGERLAAPAALRDGDHFMCGAVMLTYREAAAPLPTATHFDIATAPPRH